MARKEKGSPGPKHTQGYSKDRIILILSDFREPVDEPELRELIKERIGISEPKGIRKHLADLENDNILSITEETGKENLWRIKQDALECIVSRFQGKDEETAFHASIFCQDLINTELVTKIKTEWGCTKDSDITEKYKLYKMSDVERNKQIEDNIKNKRGYISDEDLEWILRLSPTALSNAIKHPTKKPINTNYFKELMFTSLVLDIRTHRTPTLDEAVVSLKVDLAVQFKIDNYYIQSRNKKESYTIDKHIYEETISASSENLPYVDQK